MASKVIETFVKKALFKKGGAMASNQSVKFSADALEKRIRNFGFDPDTINSEAQLNQILAYLKQAEDQAFNQLYSNVLSGDDAANFLKKTFKLDPDNVVDMTGKKIDTSQGIMGGKSVKELLESGEITKGTVTKKSDKVKEREMFKEANDRLNKTDVVADIIAKITSMEPVAALKEANKVIKREGIYKNLDKTQSKKILVDSEDWIFQRDPNDLYDYSKKRPFRDDPDFDPDDPDYQDYVKNRDRDDYYTGGMVDVEPNLSDIGHGSDALMARTRLVSPNGQATTSTGLNYLLAEDNDNIRIPFKKGTDLKRRAFLKLLGALTGGIASIKSGILGLSGKEAPAQATKEVIKQSTPNAPPYFFRLVEKIRFMGDDTVASQDKTIAKKYKDYVMEEDFAGNITIVKSKMDDMYPEEVIMRYQVDDTAVRNKDGFTRSADYEEYTATPDGDGKMKNVEQGVPDEVIEEAGDTTAMTLKKADGGRIGFNTGKSFAKLLADKTITGSSRRFLEKVFGKESFEEMIKNDPDLYRGLLETVEMFRKRDKEGLKMYMQKFLPHMDDETVEDFIVGSGGTEGIQGQLIRLGSGRDYAGKLEAMDRLKRNQALSELDVTDEMKRKPNASGGIAKLLGE